MEIVWASEIMEATRTQEAAQIVVSKHADKFDGYCTHIQVVPSDGRQSFKVMGMYDLTIDEAMVNAASRFSTL